MYYEKIGFMELWECKLKLVHLTISTDQPVKLTYSRLCLHN